MMVPCQHTVDLWQSLWQLLFNQWQSARSSASLFSRNDSPLPATSVFFGHSPVSFCMTSTALISLKLTHGNPSVNLFMTSVSLQWALLSGLSAFYQPLLSGTDSLLSVASGPQTASLTVSLWSESAAWHSLCDPCPSHISPFASPESSLSALCWPLSTKSAATSTNQ